MECQVAKILFLIVCTALLLLLLPSPSSCGRPNFGTTSNTFSHDQRLSFYYGDDGSGRTQTDEYGAFAYDQTDDPQKYLEGTAAIEPLTFSVMSFGARGNGHHDDSQAFLKAWEALCGSSDERTPSLLIPKERTFLLKPLVFKGPCEPETLHFQLQGRLVAPDYNSKAWESDKEKWVQFSDVDGLIIIGGRSRCN